MMTLVVNVKLLNPLVYTRPYTTHFFGYDTFDFENVIGVRNAKWKSEIWDVLSILKCSHKASKQDQIRIYCHLFVKRLAPLVVNWRYPCSVHRLLTLYIFLIIKTITPFKKAHGTHCCHWIYWTQSVRPGFFLIT